MLIAVQNCSLVMFLRIVLSIVLLIFLRIVLEEALCRLRFAFPITVVMVLQLK